MQRACAVIILCSTFVVPQPLRADFKVFPNSDREAFFATVPSVTTLDFTGFEAYTHLSDKYAASGAVFVDDFNFISHANELFPQDGAGLIANWPGHEFIRISFDQPILWVATDHPGFMEYELFSDGVSLGEVTFIDAAGADVFSGLISDQLFDEIVIRQPGTGNPVSMDNFYFGVPSPAAWIALVLGGFGCRRSRRRQPIGQQMGLR